jgi:tetratricopeptide (TPR) repeat protein
LLQQGRLKEASELVEELRQIADRTRHPQPPRTLLRMVTRAAVETGAVGAAELPGGDPYLDRALTYANAALATGLAAAARKDATTVRVALDRIEHLERSAAGHGRTEWAAKLAIMCGEVAAAAHLEVGNREDAWAAMHEAAAREDRLEAPRGPPNPVKPARELLGEMLLRVDRPAEAAVEFEKTLARHARRLAALLGLARALARLGRTEEAKERYREMLNILVDADSGRAADEARAFLGRGG